MHLARLPFAGGAWTIDTHSSTDTRAVLDYAWEVHESQQVPEPIYKSRLPGALARLKRWLVAHHMTLMTIADTAALHCTRFGHRNIFRFYSAYTAQDVIVDRSSMGLSLQQNRCCHRRHTARRGDLGDACDLHCRIPFGCWSLCRPAAHRIRFRQFGLHDYVDWHVFSRVVWPTFWPAFVGSLFLAIPSAITVYFSHAHAGESLADCLMECAKRQS
jgi:hypothetical protein